MLAALYGAPEGLALPVLSDACGDLTCDIAGDSLTYQFPSHARRGKAANANENIGTTFSAPLVVKNLSARGLMQCTPDVGRGKSFSAELGEKVAAGIVAPREGLKNEGAGTLNWRCDITRHGLEFREGGAGREHVVFFLVAITATTEAHLALHLGSCLIR